MSLTAPELPLSPGISWYQYEAASSTQPTKVESLSKELPLLEGCINPGFSHDMNEVVVKTLVEFPCAQCVFFPK